MDCSCDYKRSGHARKEMELNLLQFWLLGYEFPATLMVFTPAVLYIVTTEKKGKSLSSVQSIYFCY